MGSFVLGAFFVTLTNISWTSYITMGSTSLFFKVFNINRCTFPCSCHLPISFLVCGGGGGMVIIKATLHGYSSSFAMGIFVYRYFLEVENARWKCLMRNLEKYFSTILVSYFKKNFNYIVAPFSYVIAVLLLLICRNYALIMKIFFRFSSDLTYNSNCSQCPAQIDIFSFTYTICSFWNINH